jgi:hypothetical protein
MIPGYGSKTQAEYAHDFFKVPHPPLDTDTIRAGCTRRLRCGSDNVCDAAHRDKPGPWL